MRKNREIRELLEAKQELYGKLLLLEEDEITKNEIDIMYHLAKDEQIKELFKNKSNENK